MVLGEVFCVQLLVLKVGLLVSEAVSMLTHVGVEFSLTYHERQFAALFCAPEFHSKMILYVASSKLHLLTLLLTFFAI